MRLVIKTGEVLCFLIVMLSSVLFAQPTVAAAAAAVSVTAGVDRNSLNPDDTLTLTVSVNSGDEVSLQQPTLPPINDFEVLNAWTSQEARASFVTTPNGPEFKTVRTMRFNYMLQPKHQGKLLIPGVEVVVDGKSFVTKPVSINVAPGAGVANQGRNQQNGRNQPPAMAQPPPGFGAEDDSDSPEDDIFQQLLRRTAPPAVGSRNLQVDPNEAFFIQADSDKKEAYVGEQVTVSWYLYTRGQIRDLDTLKYPSLKGFWKEDLEIATHLNFVEEMVNGIPYKKALLASFALFPIKDGTSIIDSYTAKCSVIMSVDAFSGLGFGKAYSYTKTSLPSKILVKPLPNEGRPADFTGAVGDFQVSAAVEEKNPVANQPFAFKIRFEGRGNAKLIDIPPFQPPQGLEVYDTQKDAKFFKSGTSYKDFSIMLVPRAEGDYTIPPVSTSIFDPVSKRYVTKSTEAVHVHVGKGEARPDKDPSVPMGASGETKKKVEDPQPHLELEYKSGFSPSPQLQTTFFAGLFTVIGLTLLWRARRELGWGEKKKDLSRRLKARLKKVDNQLAAGDWRSVGVEMTNTVYFILGALSGEGGAHVEFEKLLLQAPPSVRRELGDALKKSMETFQVLTFAPEDVVGQLKEKSQLKKAVSEMTRLLERAVSLGVSAGRSEEKEN
jgi:hypothetical protein